MLLLKQNLNSLCKILFCQMHTDSDKLIIWQLQLMKFY